MAIVDSCICTAFVLCSYNIGDTFKGHYTEACLSWKKVPLIKRHVVQWVHVCFYVGY